MTTAAGVITGVVSADIGQYESPFWKFSAQNNTFTFIHCSFVFGSSRIKSLAYVKYLKLLSGEQRGETEQTHNQEPEVIGQLVSKTIA